MNMKKRLTRGKGVAERIISGRRGAEESENRSIPTLPAQVMGEMASALLLSDQVVSFLTAG